MEGLYPCFKKGRLGHFTQNAQKIYLNKCGGIRYAPDISLFLLSKRWNHFAPIAYTKGFKTDTKDKNMCTGSCKLLTMYECPRLHWGKNSLGFCCAYTKM